MPYVDELIDAEDADDGWFGPADEATMDADEEEEAMRQQDADEEEGFDPTNERLWKHGFLLKPINRADEFLSRFRVYRSIIGRFYGRACDWYDCADVRGRIAHWIIDSIFQTHEDERR